ncbi:MAG TPA: chitobiase/beta-hexosaminidase C-terminal domain-containing protein, partial [Fibrobacteria bacterium]|nr:chitobiase/beta-hexosaminidase C-terminal domain-containing protein [Fibrobacteria bacterium]
MRKPIIWATSLVVAILAGVLVSCDSKGSAPTSSNNSNNGTGSTSYLLSLTSPLALDTTVPNGTTEIWVTGKVLPAQATSVVASFNGTTDTVTTNGGLFSIPVSNLPIGQTSVKVKLLADTTQFAKILVLRQIGAPQLLPVVPVGALPTATSFTDSAVIQLNSPNSASDSIWYTTNGASAAITSSDPKVISGSKKTLNGTTTIKAIAIEHTSYGTLTSDTTLVTYSINQKEGTPYFNVSRYDSSNVPVKISITAVGATDTIRFTTTGGDPNSSSPIFKDSILVTDSTTIIAKAFSGLNVPSPACTTTVKLIALAPVFSDTVVQKTSQAYLKLTTPSSTSQLPVPVYYTLDGSTPTIQSLKYNDSILLNGNVTIKAIAALPYWRPSSVVSHSYTFQVATPVLSSATGTYDTTQLLKITDSAAGASVHYTLDGSLPTCSSPVYNPASSLRLDSTAVVNARACITGWDSSNVVTGNDTFH